MTIPSKTKESTISLVGAEMPGGQPNLSIKGTRTVNAPPVVYAARLDDLMAEASLELDDQDFADFLALVAHAVSRRVIDAFEERWSA